MNQVTRKSPAGRQPYPREDIVAAALRVFLEHGYGVNIDLIAKAAGVARTTLYNQFGSKEGLLRAVVQDSSQAFMDPLTHREGDDLHSLLTFFARQFDATASTEEGIAFARFYVADLANFPDLARLAYETGMENLTTTLAGYLKRKMDIGEIAEIDPVAMAERFFGALIGFMRHRVYAGLGVDSSRRRARYVRDTVDMFVRAMQPE